MFRYALFAVILFIIGSCCGSAPHFFEPSKKPSGTLVARDVYIDPAFKEEEREAISAAMDSWIEAANGLVELKYGTEYFCGDKLIIQPVLSTSQIVKDYQNEKKNFGLLGLTWHDGCTWRIILVIDRLSRQNDLRILATHEIGHALGVDHVEDDRSVMHYTYRYGYTAGCLTKEDMTGFCLVNGCDISEMRYCVIGCN